MKRLISTKAIHLFLLVLVLALLQPQPHPAFLLEDLQAELDPPPESPQTLTQTLDRMMLMYPVWNRPAELALQSALNADNPELALQILEDHQPALLGNQPCLPIELYLSINDSRAALHEWHSIEDTCRLQPEILTPLVQYHLKQQDFTSAAELQALLVEQSPQDPEAYLQLARIWSVSEPEKALAPLQVVRSITDDDSSLVINLIRTIEDTRAQDSAAYTLANVGILYAARAEWDYAVWALTNATQLEPDYAEALAYLGHALDESGSSGRSVLEKAARLDPDSMVTWILLARHWIRNSDLDKAEEALAHAAELDPRSPVAAALTGEILALKGDHDSASLAYLRACQLEPDIPDFWILLAEYSLAYEVNTGMLAMQAARKAVLLDPDNAYALDLLGFSHYLEGSLDVASRLLERSAGMAPNSASAAFHLGLTYLEQGKKDSARSELARAASLEPSGYYGELARRTLDTLQR